MEKNEKIKYFFAGLIVGSGLGMVASWFFPCDVYLVKKYDRPERQQEIITLHKEFGPDKIMIKNKQLEIYEPLVKYLECIKDKNKREVEKSAIEKIVKN